MSQQTYLNIIFRNHPKAEVIIDHEVEPIEHYVVMLRPDSEKALSSQRFTGYSLNQALKNATNGMTRVTRTRKPRVAKGQTTMTDFIPPTPEQEKGMPSREDIFPDKLAARDLLERSFPAPDEGMEFEHSALDRDRLDGPGYTGGA